MKGFRYWILAMGILAFGGLACSRSEREKPALAVTSAPEAVLLERISGGDFDIVTLVPPSADAETYEPDVATLKDLQDARIYMHLNTPGFERNLVEQTKRSLPELKLADVSRTVNKITGTHGSHDGHAEADPHMLTSLRNARLIASRMRVTLSDNFPERAGFINARADSLDLRLRELDDSLTRVLAPAYGRAYVVMHPSMSYFARDYGLRQIALQEEGREPSPKQYRARLDSARAARPVVLFYERGSDKGRAEEAARELGIPAVEITFSGRDFIEEIKRAAAAISMHNSK